MKDGKYVTAMIEMLAAMGFVPKSDAERIESQSDKLKGIHDESTPGKLIYELIWIISPQEPF